ncbi:hypothetical protein PSPO01_14499 [Paraphaeosphaeria sporulosa]
MADYAENIDLNVKNDNSLIDLFLLVIIMNNFFAGLQLSSWPKNLRARKKQRKPLAAWKKYAWHTRARIFELQPRVYHWLQVVVSALKSLCDGVRKLPQKQEPAESGHDDKSMRAEGGQGHKPTGVERERAR